MPEGRRYSPENPSPAMKDFAQYIRDHGYPNVTDEAVAATSMFHKEWQRGHAERVRQEREATKGEREAAAAEKKAKAEQRKKEAADKKAAKEAAAAEKKAKKEAEAAAKEGADGDDSGDEPTRTSRRLRTRGEEPVAAGVGSGETSF